MAKKAAEGGIVYLALSAFLVVFLASEIMDFGLLFAAMLVPTAVAASILIAQFLLFDRKPGSRNRQIIGALCIIIITIAQLAFLVAAKGYLILSNFKFVQYMVISAFIVMAALLPFIFGAEILRRFKDQRLRALGLMLIFFAIFAVGYFFIIGFSRVSITDAAWLTYKGDKALLAGHNPYPLNYSGLYNAVDNGTANSFTLTTNGKIVGVVGYPFLYLLLSMPFAAYSQGVFQFSQALLVQEIACAILLFAVIAHFARGIGKKEFIAILLVVPLLFFTLVSLTDIFMIAILVIAYLRPQKWYFGILLGIAVSIQQLAWVPAILLLLYSMFTGKQKKTLLDIVVFAATVLIINGYFLLASPLSYLHDLLGQLGSVLPTALSPFGSLIIRYYNIPLPYFQPLFYLALGASAVAFLYLGRKRNFAILSLVPFLFLSFSRIEYYTVFLAIGVLVIVLEGDALGKVSKVLIKPKFACIALGAFAILMVAVVVYGHAVYIRSLPITAYDASASASKGNLTYSALLSSGNFSGEDRVLLYSFYANFTGDIPVFIIGDNVALGGSGGNFSYSYNSVNGQPDNLIDIPSGLNGNERLTIVSGGDYGTYAGCAIYGDAYFYICPTAEASSVNS